MVLPESNCNERRRRNHVCSNPACNEYVRYIQNIGGSCSDYGDSMLAMRRALVTVSRMSGDDLVKTLDRLFITGELISAADPVAAIKAYYPTVESGDTIAGDTVAELFQSVLDNSGPAGLVAGKYIFPAVYPAATIAFSTDVSRLDQERGVLAGFLHSIKLWILEKKYGVVIPYGKW